MDVDRAEHAWRLSTRAVRKFVEEQGTPHPGGFSGYTNVTDPIAELEAQLLAPAPEMTRATGLTNRVFDPIAKAVDDYLLMERKARAWDELLAAAARGELDCCQNNGEVLAYLQGFVHPAQDPSTR